jgi:hypothetical protein
VGGGSASAEASARKPPVPATPTPPPEFRTRLVVRSKARAFPERSTQQVALVMNRKLFRDQNKAASKAASGGAATATATARSVTPVASSAPFAVHAGRERGERAQLLQSPGGGPSASPLRRPR